MNGYSFSAQFEGTMAQMIIFVFINPHIMTKLNKHGLSFEEYSDDKVGEYFAVAKELVECLFYDMAKLCTRYSNGIVHDLPYTYKERSLDSVLLPALSKLCDGMVLTELPVTRQCNNRRFQIAPYTGRIDYWCIYKGYSFVIELKHSYDCFTTPTTSENKVTDLWITMNEQLQSVEKDIKEYVESTKGVIRLGLHIITSYSDKTPNNSLINQFKNNIPKTIERFQRDLSKRYPSLRPDLLICWKIPARIVMKEQPTFPGLWAVAKIYPAIFHEGARK